MKDFSEVVLGNCNLPVQKASYGEGFRRMISFTAWTGHLDFEAGERCCPSRNIWVRKGFYRGERCVDENEKPSFGGRGPLISVVSGWVELGPPHPLSVQVSQRHCRSVPTPDLVLEWEVGSLSHATPPYEITARRKRPRENELTRENGGDSSVGPD
jgi:hypothetical protein